METNDWVEAQKMEKLVKKAVQKIRDAYFELIKENGINLSLGKYLAKYQPLHSLGFSDTDPLPIVRNNLLLEKQYEAKLRGQNYKVEIDKEDKFDFVHYLQNYSTLGFVANDDEAKVLFQNLEHRLI